MARSTDDPIAPDTPSPRRVEIACKYHKRLSYGYLLSTWGDQFTTGGFCPPSCLDWGAGLWATDAGAAPGVWKPTRD